MNFNKINRQLKSAWNAFQPRYYGGLNETITSEFIMKNGVKIKQLKIQDDFCQIFGLKFTTLCLNADELGLRGLVKNKKGQIFRNKTNNQIANSLETELLTTLKGDLKPFPTTSIWVFERHFDGTPHLHCSIFYPSCYHLKIQHILCSKYQFKGAVGTKFRAEYLAKTTSKHNGKQFNTSKISGVQNFKTPKFYVNKPPKITQEWGFIADLLNSRLKGFFIKKTKSRIKKFDNSKNPTPVVTVKKTYFLQGKKPIKPPKNRCFSNKIDIQIRTKDGARIHIKRKLKNQLNTQNLIKKLKIKSKKFTKKGAKLLCILEIKNALKMALTEQLCVANTAGRDIKQVDIPSNADIMALAWQLAMEKEPPTDPSVGLFERSEK
ncbi:hypothetical protein [Campylobacter geochelonis]|uniref:Uncharacterized protein n=1 Tax=Campylobacter geochelonis TaxID=1780362 RepID=A0A128EI35_9BACT|nr:hypothetical protein [Campylobacter geochelonis]QKF71356.1 hypothetical protein CGEO_1044 [Campylobacter geochelonis]CZE48267.1 Uncharacterised protein [Campylobacter geochelonis]